MNSIARSLAPFLVFVIAACSPSSPTTPPEGSAEREAIFAAMHQGREIQDQVFVTSNFKVQNGWAWVTADPQSKDGANHYEPESWLLQKSPGGKLPPGPVGSGRGLGRGLAEAWPRSGQARAAQALSSTSTKTNSKSLGLMTSCSTPFSRL